jgi:hypothetical protein
VFPLLIRYQEVPLAGLTEKLNLLKLRDFPDFYGSLENPAIASLTGYYSGTFVGPRWLRAAAGPGLVLSGLRGWWGKFFSGDGNAINLVQRNGKLEKRFPMKLVQGDSMIDGKPGIALHYEIENPFPWPYIADELRLVSPGTLLGMTYIRIKPLQGLVLPFLLQHQEQVDGL